MIPRRERGLALITVLLIMALVTLLVAGMLRSHRLLTASIAQQVQSSQLLQLALAGERYGLRQIRQQMPELLKVTHPGQAWAKPRLIELESGSLRLHIEDLASRFNLTSLMHRAGANDMQLERWQRLCETLGIEPPDLQALEAHLLLDPSQLRLIPGIDGDAVERLRPWVAVLPGDVGLNINTASPRVLSALEEVDAQTAMRLAHERPQEGYPSVQAFLATPALEGLGTRSHGLAVISRWFRLHVRVDALEQRMHLYSEFEIDARAEQVRVVRRVFSTLEEPVSDG